MLSLSFQGLFRRFRAVPLLVLLVVAAAGCSGTNDSIGALAPVDLVVVDKGARTLVLMSDGATVRRYRVALGRAPVGPKRYEGDGRTPEGLYHIDGRNPNSRYHLSLHISYPSESDIVLAAARGRAAGSDIMIHGLPNGVTAEAAALHPDLDWTDGCIALTNREMEEVWSLVADGTPILITP